MSPKQTSPEWGSLKQVFKYKQILWCQKWFGQIPLKPNAIQTNVT